MTRKSSLVLLGFLACCLCASPAVSQEVDETIFVTVLNPHPQDRYVTVTDELCGKVVLDGRLVGHGSVSVELCAVNFRGGTVTITNVRSGAQRRFDDVTRGAKLQVP
jgi:hypothetical protein